MYLIRLSRRIKCRRSESSFLVTFKYNDEIPGFLKIEKNVAYVYPKTLKYMKFYHNRFNGLGVMASQIDSVTFAFIILSLDTSSFYFLFSIFT